MATGSAGLLLYRRRPDGLKIFLIHMGGPFWAKKGCTSLVDPEGRDRRAAQLPGGHKYRFLLG
jgi:predicted NUDIX family NTP pyrophosphohydrolase